MPIKGTKQGNEEEMELVKKLNLDKTSSLWQDIEFENNLNYYAVRCTAKVLSKKVIKKFYQKLMYLLLSLLIILYLVIII